MRTIYRKFDKHEIAKMPRAFFDGDIKVVTTEQEADEAVDFLLNQSILGVDTETRPSFQKGVSHKVCLLQVSTETTCYLFRLNRTGLTPSIIRLLTDTTIPKIGLSWHDDLHQLHGRGEFQPGWFVELQDVASDFGVQDMSLQKLYANLFHQKISKTQRLSNWEVEPLKDAQKVYAATDAWACIQLYKEFQGLRASGDYELLDTNIPEPEVKEEDDVAKEVEAAVKAEEPATAESETAEKVNVANQ